VKEDEVSCFVTNMNVDGNKAMEYAGDFRSRWGIETSYRVKGDFRPKMTSKNLAVRLFYFLFSVVMYNLWFFAEPLVFG